MRRLVSHISEEWFVNESFYFYFQKATLQRRYNAGDGSHKIEPRYKWYRAITTSALSAPPTNPNTSSLPVRTTYLTNNTVNKRIYCLPDTKEIIAEVTI